ncbi:MAG: hypothetical protein JO062_09595 [Bryobacterales bacterium]|nr:hypothetical protein [Bryobacterales bacterium]
MKALAVMLLLAPCALGDEAADRKAIESIVAALNEHKQPAMDLLTPQAKQGGEASRLSELQRLLSLPNRPWSETTVPRLVIRSIQFVTPDVATVDAEITQYGTFQSWSVPVVLIMRKDADWRIAAIRIFGF